MVITGFQPGESYFAVWRDTYQLSQVQQITATEILTASEDGFITLSVNYLTTDVAVKICPVSGTDGALVTPSTRPQLSSANMAISPDYRRQQLIDGQKVTIMSNGEVFLPIIFKKWVELLNHNDGIRMP